MEKIRKTKIFNNNLVLLAIVLVVIYAFFSIVTDYFSTPRNITAILNQTSINGILAIGMTVCIIVGGIDMSIGSILSLSGIILAVALRAGLHPVIAVILCLATGIVCGTINGAFVSIGKLPPFIATVGMGSIAGGIALIITNGSPISGVSSSIAFLGSGRVLKYIPNSTILMLTLMVLAWFLLEKTRTGRYFYAIGGNIESARLSGINVIFYKALPFAIAGLMAGISAIVMTGRLNSAEATAGVGFHLDAIAATVIGGTSMSGGEGKIVGTFIGAFIMSIIRNGMIQMGLGTYPQEVVIGAIIILVVLTDMINRKRAGA